MREIPQSDARFQAVLVTFFHALKSAGVPVTLREYLTLMEAMEQDLAPAAWRRSTTSPARRS